MTTIKQITQALSNQFNAVLGRKQKLIELIQNGDISRLLGKMTTCNEKIIKALEEYDPTKHQVTKRPNHHQKGKPDIITAKLPIPFQKIINMQATAFLFGSPVQFSDLSDVVETSDTNGKTVRKSKAAEAYDKALKIFTDTRFDSNMRESKTKAGSETLCAKLYHLYLSPDGELQVMVKILAKSLGDDIYYKFDDFGRLMLFIRQFTIQDDEGNDEIHCDIYTDETIFRCTQKAIGWEVVPEKNFIGKIPVLLYIQEPEWADVQRLIERREDIQCRDADMNDYFANPKVVGEGIISGSLNPDDPAQIIQTQNNGKVYYLTYDSAPENRKRECDTLDSFIFGMTCSVNPASDVIKEMKIPSGVSWDYMFFFPILKAKNYQDYYGTMIDREINVVKAIVGVLYPELKLNGQLEALKIGYQFSTPMPDNVSDTLDIIQKSINAGTMSQETAIYQNPRIKDPKTEMKRLQSEKDRSNTPNNQKTLVEK